MELPAGFVLDAPAPPLPPKGKTWADALMGDAKNAGIVQTAAEQAGQGLTFNLMDEGQNAIGAGLAYVVGKGQDLFRPEGQRLDESYGDLYNAAAEASKKRLAMQMEQRPALAIGSQLVGGLLTGGAGATTKGGTAVANSLRSGRVLGQELGLAGRAGKAALLGSATGSLSGAGAGSGLENRLESAGDGAVAGGIVGGAIPVVGSVAGKVAKQFQKNQAVASADDIKAMANEAYKKADESGGVLKGWFTNRFLDDIKDIQPATIAGKQVPTNPELAKALDYVNSFKNTRLTLQDAQNLDEYLGDAIDGFTTLGQVDKNGTKLLQVQKAFRNAIENADDTLIEGGKAGFDSLKQGRALWSAQIKMRDIERIMKRAELSDNPATIIKTGFKNILTSAKNSKGYSKEELKLIEKAANTGVISDILRTGGSRLVPIIAGAAGGGVMGTAAAGAGSMASRGIATKNAMIKADKVARAISERAAPATKEVGGLPAVLGSKSAGQLAAPAGQAAGTLNVAPEPTKITISPNQPSYQPLPEVNLPEGFVIDGAETQTVITPMSNNATMPATNDLMGQIKQAESGGNPNAKNPLSSASGLYQFTDSTWKSAVDKWGRRAGIKYSDKANPQAQEAMMSALTQDNARILQNKGIEPSDGNLYFAHFMGAPAASKAISLLGKNAVAARSFPDAAKANPTVFFEGKRPRTIDEVYQLITSKVG